MTAALFVCISVAPAAQLEAEKPPATLSLAGTWRFELDREDAGVRDRWFERALSERIALPGALQNQGFGDEIAVDTKWTGEVGADRWLRRAQYERYRQPGNIKVPFFLQPERHYVGAAWYQRDFDVPAAWRGKRVVLTIERAHWETRVWVDGRPAGAANDSLATPHVYDLGTKLEPGKRTLTVRADNRVIQEVGTWSHSVSDHTQGNWNGMIGRLELAATSPVWLDDIAVFPNVAARSATLKIRIGNATGTSGAGVVRAGKQSAPCRWDEAGGSVELVVPLGGDAPLWDEFTPALHRLTIELAGDAGIADSRTVAFGLREIGTQGRSFILNGRPTFFRGTLECCIFPLTGYPPTEVEAWRRIIRIAKEHGLNHFRFHSWCPPEAAFIAADELGFYYQVECGVWTRIGDGAPIDQWIYEESRRIVRAYGNHPSFVLMTHGNEPNGPNHTAYLSAWVTYWKERDPRRLHTSGSAYPQLPVNQYHVYHGPRGPGGWLGRDYRDAVKNFAVPTIVHEMGQWCVYPNFDEIAKYTGPLKPKNFEIFRDSLAEHGMLERWRDFLHASGKLQLLCYKEEAEAAFRTPGVGGVQLLDLHDFPGQGTALVGVLDPFWDGKGYVTPAEFRRFFGPTVPLARLLRRTWTTDETLVADAEVAHYGAAPLAPALAAWTVLDDAGRAVAGDTFPVEEIPLGSGFRLGAIGVELSRLPAPRRYTLAVTVGTFRNEWSFWVYPAARPRPSPAGVTVATAFDDGVRDRLAAGETVLLATAKCSPAHPRLGFEPIFWNRYMFNTQGRQTLGLLCDPKHPALARFPTESFQDWQWQEIVTHARGVILDGLPARLMPIVQVIDDWNTNRRLGLIFECRLGRGKLLVCAADLETDLDRRPAARQLRESLLAYAGGDGFAPALEVGIDEFANIFLGAGSSTLVKLGARVVRADSEDRANGNTADKAIDGDPDTIWHTQWSEANPPFPHEIVVDMGKLTELRGFRLLPRQEMSNGWFTAYEFSVSADGASWGSPAASGDLPADAAEKVIAFARPERGRFIRLRALAGYQGNPWAAIAELDVVAAP